MLGGLGHAPQENFESHFFVDGILGHCRMILLIKHTSTLHDLKHKLPCLCTNITKITYCVQICSITIGS